MQAICGYVRLDGAPARPEAIATLNANLCPNDRFPTKPFAWVQGSAGFGHVRWGGRSSEPSDAICHDPESGCTVAADARLDERRALAHALGLDAAAPLSGSAELILRAWLRWGEGCADRLRGDFAFAIWNERERRLYLARDIMGQRPFNVHYQPAKLVVFATRAMALIALPEVPDAINEGRIADALVTQLEGIDKTSTFFAEVKRLPPAHWATIAPAGRKESEYWRPAPGRVALPHCDREWAEALTDVLEAAVRRHLEGDQVVGSMLSGGMDSSSLAVIAADQLRAAGRPALKTFSSVSDDPEEPETRAVRAMLAHPGFDPTLIDPHRIDAMRVELLRAWRCSDEPFDGLMLLLHAQYLAASEAGVDALIDGGSGDVLFLEGSAIARQIRRGQWLGAWRNIRGLQRVYPGCAGWRYPLSFARAALVPDTVRRQWRRWHPRPDPVQEVLVSGVIAPEFARRVDLRQRLRQLDTWSAATDGDDTATSAVRKLLHPYGFSGTERYLRVAAWHGVQPRSPFDDRDVIDLCVNLPDSQRIRDGWPKAVLREAMRGRMPESVRLRQGKQHLGWSLVWRLLSEVNELRADLGARESVLAPYVDMSRMQQALDRAERGDDDGLSDALEVGYLGNWLASLHDRVHPRPVSARAVPATVRAGGVTLA